MMSKRQLQQPTFKINSRITQAMLALTLALTVAVVPTPQAHAQTYSVLYSFSGQTDGAYPYGGVILDAAGNVYGTTFQGGDLEGCGLFKGCGVVYKVDPSGKQTVLHTFRGNADGRQPYFGNLLLDTAGNLFGTTVYGGMKGNIGMGTAFEVATTGRETVLHRFIGGAKDGQQPSQGLIQDANGDFYGTTVAGGNGPYGGYGTVYRMSKSGKVAVLHSFIGNDGVEPTGWLTQDSAGNFYGTAITGGPTGAGTVFKITKTGKFTLLYTFKGAPDGFLPQGALAVDKAGNVYGATSEGGNANACPAFGCGVIFKISKNGKDTILHTFVGPDGAAPSGGVLLDAAGNLYGTTWAGGAHGNGSIFKLDKTGKLTTLYSFTGGTDGGLPFAGLTADQAGNFYGTTNLGGITKCESGCGVVFKLTP
jgi:uncharacterized repeat protein (TIGR03803 family)